MSKSTVKLTQSRNKTSWEKTTWSSRTWIQMGFKTTVGAVCIFLFVRLCSEMMDELLHSLCSTQKVTTVRLCDLIFCVSYRQMLQLTQLRWTSVHVNVCLVNVKKIPEEVVDSQTQNHTLRESVRPWPFTSDCKNPLRILIFVLQLRAELHFHWLSLSFMSCITECVRICPVSSWTSCLRLIYESQGDGTFRRNKHQLFLRFKLHQHKQ